MIQIYLLSGKDIIISECNNFDELFNKVYQNYNSNKFFTIYDFTLIPLSGEYILLNIDYNNIINFNYDDKVEEYNLVFINNKKFKYYLNDDYNNNLIKFINIDEDMTINNIIKLLDYNNNYKKYSLNIKLIIKEHLTDNIYIEANINIYNIFNIDMLNILSIDNYNFNIEIANEIIFDVYMYYYDPREYL